MPRPIRIILADDHPIVLSGLESLLSTLPDSLIAGSAHDGVEALALIRELEPEIALLDIRMPKLSGLEVLEAVKGAGLSTRVVFLTSSATDTQIAMAVRCGAWGMLLKESASDTLLDCIQRVAAGERWLPSELVDAALKRETERSNDSKQIENALTPRERELAGLVAQGASNKEIARQLSISEGTVKMHLHNIYEKVGVSNRTALAALAHRHLLDRPS